MKRPWTASCAALGVAVFGLASLPREAQSGEQTIDMFQGSFLPQTVTIELGDAVSWVWRRGTHTVTSGLVDGAAGTPEEPGALFDEPLDEAHPLYRRVFDESREGGYPFFCRLHPEQIGFIEVSRGEIRVRVAVVDNVFNPEVAYIFEGDSIRWEHEPMEDYHTVTSGLVDGEPGTPLEPGALFDEESSDQFPIFEYRFDDAGDYPYFCIPHVDMGMKGVIHVQERFVRGDATGEGLVDISDAVATLGYLFLGTSIRCCADAVDSNDDGAVDIGDPIFTLNFLYTGGAKIPRPYPLAGGDRTEDGILCCYFSR